MNEPDKHENAKIPEMCAVVEATVGTLPTREITGHVTKLARKDISVPPGN